MPRASRDTLGDYVGDPWGSSGDYVGGPQVAMGVTGYPRGPTHGYTRELGLSKV